MLQTTEAVNVPELDVFKESSETEVVEIDTSVLIIRE
jgi:hypothetical protein